MQRRRGRRRRNSVARRGTHIRFRGISPSLRRLSLFLPPFFALSPSRALVKGKAGERDSRVLPPARAIMSISNTTNCTQPRFCTGAPTRGNDDVGDDDDGVVCVFSPLPGSPRDALLNSPRAKSYCLARSTSPCTTRPGALHYHIISRSPANYRARGGIVHSSVPTYTRVRIRVSPSDSECVSLMYSVPRYVASGIRTRLRSRGLSLPWTRAGEGSDFVYNPGEHRRTIKYHVKVNEYRAIWHFSAARYPRSSRGFSPWPIGNGDDDEEEDDA